jgi:DNA polymerase-3 subunit alpha (Gram-positive type)
MFPKAHACAYVLDAMRVAWYKVYKPVHYYAAVFSARHNQEDIMELMKPSPLIRERIAEVKKEITQKQNNNQTKQKEDNLLKALNLALEAKERGIVFGKVRMYESNNKRYKIDGNELIPPFSAIAGVGEKVAVKIYEEAQISIFRGLDDLVARTKANKTNIGVLRELGCLEDVESKQHTFF